MSDAFSGGDSFKWPLKGCGVGACGGNSSTGARTFEAFGVHRGPSTLQAFGILNLSDLNSNLLGNKESNT